MQTQDENKIKAETPAKSQAKINKVPDRPLGLSLPNSEKLSVSIAEDLAVVLTKNAFEQLFGWAYSTAKEISCLGSVHRDGNRFFIDKFYLLRQSGSSACTELDQDAIAELIEYPERRQFSSTSRGQGSKPKCKIFARRLFYCEFLSSGIFVPHFWQEVSSELLTYEHFRQIKDSSGPPKANRR